MLVTLVVVTLFLLGKATALPSCEQDIARHCLGDDQDLSPSGIAACLSAVGDSGKLSRECQTYNDIVAACRAELQEEGGVCHSDHTNGDGMPCLLQRTPVEELSDECRSVRAENMAGASGEEDTSLKGTFWKDGKRKLTDEERDELGKDDRTLYDRWWARKQKKMAGNSDVKYAIEKQKHAKFTKIITHKAMGVARKALDIGMEPKIAKKHAFNTAKEGCRKAMKENNIKFSRKDIKAIAKAALQAAQREIKEDAKRAKEKKTGEL